MKIHTPCMLAACLFLGLSAFGQDAPTLGMEPVGIAVMENLEDKGFEFLPASRYGVTLSVLLTSVDQGVAIVAIDAEASRVDRFVDSAGKNLLEQKQTQDFGGMSYMMVHEPVGSMPTISRDGRHALVELAAPSLPVAGSQSVKVQGMLSVRVASGTQTQTVEQVTLAPGVIEVAGQKVKIKRVEKATWDDAALTVGLEMPSKLYEKLADVRFYNGGGQAVAGETIMRMALMDTAEIEYSLKQELSVAKLAFVFHDNMQVVEVPVDLEVKLGL